MTETPNDYSYTIAENLQRFKNHWQIEGRAEQTFKEYERLLSGLISIAPTPTLLDVETWLAAEKSPSVRRYKGRAIRSFGRWLTICQMIGLLVLCNGVRLVTFRLQAMSQRQARLGLVRLR